MKFEEVGMKWTNLMRPMRGSLATDLFIEMKQIDKIETETSQWKHQPNANITWRLLS